jgi:tRNAThr (cytosine32-N3)-methyltransferase
VSADVRTRALAALDAAHAADPRRTPEGRPAEAAYVERVAAWLGRLLPEASDALMLAARAQHLERWAIPRDAYPRDRTGYLKWRKAIQQRQGQRVAEILRAAGCDDALVARVAALVAKAVPRGDPEGPALEDAACLVFLEAELAAFADAHREDYAREKLVDIVRKTWIKMSPAAQALAATLPQRADVAALMTEATAATD